MKQYVDVCRHVAIFLISIFCSFSLAASELKLEKKVPFSGSATLSNSVGIGTFVSGYSRVPSLTSSLSISAGYTLPAFAGLSAMVLSASGSLNWWWLNSPSTAIFNANNRVTYSDIGLTLSAPKIGNWDLIGVFVSPELAVIAPISKVSRNLNRLLGFQINNNLTYQKKQFSISWLPSFSTWAYPGAAMTVPCGESGSSSFLPPVINPQNISFELDQYLQELVVSRKEERMGDGTCIVVGRQTIGLLSNSLKLAWDPGRHHLSISLGWYINYLRSLSVKPELRGYYASSRDFTEATMGSLVYRYRLPVDFDLSISGGIISYQASFSSQGNWNFPFFDFVTPGKNQTQFFLQLTAGI